MTFATAGPAVWPVRLRVDIPTGTVVLRPLRNSDRVNWLRIRATNHDWLSPWEATSPVPLAAREATSYKRYIKAMDREARSGQLLPFAIEFNDALAGQITLSGIQYGSLWSGSIGYWVAKNVAGRGVMPAAVALTSDYAFSRLGLHRIEINIRPENAPSLRVVSKLGFRDEGVRKGYLHIQGKWCDHRTFALLSDDIPEGVLNRYAATLSTRRTDSAVPGAASPNVGV